MYKTETTYKRWYEVYQWAIKNNYDFYGQTDSTYGAREGSEGIPGAEPTEGVNQPVAIKNSLDVLIWCNATSEMEGLKPVYKFNNQPPKSYQYWKEILKDYDSNNYSESNDSYGDRYEINHRPAWIKINDGANGYFLPYDIEMRLTARGDLSYLNNNNPDDIAWYPENSGGMSKDVGLKKPNKYGLFDIYGNLEELIFSDFQHNYAGSPDGPLDFDYFCSLALDWINSEINII